MIAMNQSLSEPTFENLIISKEISNFSSMAHIALDSIMTITPTRTFKEAYKKPYILLVKMTISVKTYS